jgi:ABC-type multidrug transport system permease subunit
MTADVIKNGFKTKNPLGMAIFGPVIIMIVLGYMVTMAGTVDTVNIGVVNNDLGMGNLTFSSKIIDELKNQDNVNVKSINQSNINGDFKEGTVDAVLVFPENFTRDLAIKNNTEVSLQVEGTDQIKTAMVNRAIINSTSEMASKSGNAVIPLTINTKSFYGTGLDFTNLFIYRIMSLVTLLLSAVIALFIILGDKNNKRFGKISSSPIKIVTSYISGISVFAFIVPLIILIYSIYVMGITIVGNIVNVALLMLLIALVGVSLGVLAATITKTERQAFGVFGLIIISQVLFSGLLVPISRFDYYVELLSYSLPLTYGLDAMKSIVLRGFSLADVGIDLVALSMIIIVATILAIIGLKLRQKKVNKDIEF